jgi:hypothetical protein
VTRNGSLGKWTITALLAMVAVLYLALNWPAVAAPLRAVAAALAG